MTRKRRRLYFVLLGLLGVGAGTALVLNAMSDNINFFFSPTELAQRHFSPDQRIQTGGLVEAGSVKKNGSDVFFTLTDTTKSLPVHYQGLLPDLFREGQGIVAEGHLGRDGVFVATEVLAKHDEKYMPKEVADALKKSGHWKEGEALPSTETAKPNDVANP
jgi:cytochrome c-type biogenesis protein CcmE